MASIIDRGKDRPKRWQVKYRTLEGSQRSRSFSLLTEAKEFKASTEVNLRSGAYIDPQRASITFGAFAEIVTPAIKMSYRPSSAARFDSAMNRVLPLWKDVKLGAIQHETVQDWIRVLVKAELAPATVHKTYLAFRKVMKVAVAEHRLPGLPWGDLEMPVVEAHEARFLEPGEVDRLADAMSDGLRAFVYLGAVCGLRAGELFGLRWSAVDMERATVEVREIVTEANGHQHVGPPKTKASRRRVPMPSLVVSELLLLHALKGPEPDSLVFPNSRGGARRATTFRSRVWKPACERAGLDGLVIHELRHSAVAGWIESGAEPSEVAARAGHRSVVTIYDRYGHQFPSQAQRVNDNIDAMYRAARETR